MNDRNFISPDEAWRFDNEEKAMMQAAGFKFEKGQEAHPGNAPSTTPNARFAALYQQCATQSRNDLVQQLLRTTDQTEIAALNAAIADWDRARSTI